MYIWVWFEHIFITRYAVCIQKEKEKAYNMSSKFECREQKITITGTIFLALVQLLKKKLSFTLTKHATGYISLQNITSKVTNLTAKQNLRNLCYVLCLK